MEKPQQQKQIHFHNQRPLTFGRNLYVTGNIPELNSWSPKRAIKMLWTQNHHWRVSIPVRQDFEGIIEYKFIEADDNGKNVDWDPGFNQKLYVHGSNSGSFTNLDTSNTLNYGRSGSGSLLYHQYIRSSSLQDDFNYNQIVQNNKQNNLLKVMSFNISHIMDERWQKRSKLILQGIEQENAEFVGVQEVMPYQREYLKGNLNNYLYFGRSRSNDQNDLENGILYRKDRFFKQEGGNIWYSNTNCEPDYGAKEPRMLTWGIFQDLNNPDISIGVISTQYDDQSEISQKKSSEIIANLSEKFKSSCDMLIITGDFQQEESSDQLQPLELGKTIQSARQNYDPETNQLQKGNREDKIQKKFITYHAFQGEKCTTQGKQQDHIFYVDFTEKFTLYNFRVLKNVKKVKKNQENNSIYIYPSSHYPILTEFSENFQEDQIEGENCVIEKDNLIENY